MSDSDYAQTKITETVQILQEQRNSALDMLVNTTADLKIVVNKFTNSQKNLKELGEKFNELEKIKNNLSVQLAESKEQVVELTKVNEELKAALDKIKAKAVPRISRSSKPT
jgi:chromosome segregation ATPase